MAGFIVSCLAVAGTAAYLARRFTAGSFLISNFDFQFSFSCLAVVSLYRAQSRMHDDDI
jgi:hypothetical protein